MRRRPGITLIEVLVAIFIMTIGLLALLTLFPLGALRMAQALQDDRDAAAASAGANYCDIFGVRNDPQYDPPAAMPGQNPPPSMFATTPYATAPFPTTPPPSNPNGFQQYATVTGPGYPIYVDPFGLTINGPVMGASATSPGIWRVSPSASIFPAAGIPEPNGQTASVAARYFQLPDDITFFSSGAPGTGTPPNSTPFQRGGRYTWAYLLHRFQPYVRGSSVDLAVVVYAGRATQAPGGEATFPAAGVANDTSVLLTFAGAQPNIHRGSWILDTSYNPVTSSVHGDFYRVVSVTTVGANTLNLELAIPLSKPDGINAVTVLDNVVDVFERGTGDSSKWEFRTE